MKTKIFICYRRADSENSAGRLYDSLTSRIDAKQIEIFKDIYSIGIGEDFDKVASKNVGQADYVLVVIGPEFLSQINDEGENRLFSPDDFVHKEIYFSLSLDKKIIPILVENALMPSQDKLPDQINSLAFKNALSLRSSDWQHDISKLIEGMNLHEFDSSESSASVPSTSAGDEDQSDSPGKHRFFAKMGCGGFSIKIIMLATILIFCFDRFMLNYDDQYKETSSEVYAHTNTNKASETTDAEAEVEAHYQEAELKAAQERYELQAEAELKAAQESYEIQAVKATKNYTKARLMRSGGRIAKSNQVSVPSSYEVISYQSKTDYSGWGAGGSGGAGGGSMVSDQPYSPDRMNTFARWDNRNIGGNSNFLSWEEAMNSCGKGQTLPSLKDWNGLLETDITLKENWHTAFQELMDLPIEFSIPGISYKDQLIDKDKKASYWLKGERNADRAQAIIIDVRNREVKLIDAHKSDRKLCRCINW